MLNFPKWKIILVALVCLWGIYQSLPNFVKSSWLPEGKVKLGLDLQGGSHLLLQVDFDSFLKEQMDSYVDDLRKSFRKAKIGYLNLGIASGEVDGENKTYIKFNLRDPAKVEEATSVIADVSNDFEILGAETSSFKLYYNEAYLKKLQRGVLEKSIEIVRRRVDETGTREPSIQMQGTNRILLQVPGLQDPENLKRLLGKTAKMSFHLMDDVDPFAVNTRKPKANYMLLEDIDPKSTQKYNVKKRVALSGDLLIDSQPTFDAGRPVVSFKFNNLGGKKFAKITADNINKPFAVVLDGKVITAPRINTPILGGSGIITGSFTTQEAKDLSLLLRSGALPAPISVIEERTVGPSLGADSIEAGKNASIIAIILVIVVMLALYRRFGVFSNIALVFNLILILAVLSVFGATLTLPGIAGIVLTMGMAVDSNVLIFERIKEEISLGKTPYAAVDNGFATAFKTILDSNITTLIATFLLFTYGTGPVKGFAVTLSIGILCSMFSAILLTRLFVVTWLKRTKPKTLKI